MTQRIMVSCIILLSVCQPLSSSFGADLVESWYLSRGRSNPQVFVNQIPRLAAIYTIDDTQDISFAACPALQDIDEATQASVFRVGADAHATYTARLSKPWLLKLMADYTQIASIYI